MEPKERILLAATDLLLEKQNADQVTIREIAARAGVGIGLINYHYHSREALLKEAFDRMFLLRIQPWLDDLQTGSQDPLVRLKMMILTSAELCLDNLSFAKAGLAYELTNGDMRLPQMILPLLREIDAGHHSELDLRLKAISLLSVLQAMLIRLEAFEAYMGSNFRDPDQREKLIDQFIRLVVAS